MNAVPLWVDKYRGAPFQRGASGPDAFDCYGLVRAVLVAEFGYDVPELDQAHHWSTHQRLTRAVDADASPWRAVSDAPRAGDVLAMLGLPSGELHVGVVLDSRWMIHALSDHGVSTARWDRLPWCGFVFERYRHRDALEAL